MNEELKVLSSKCIWFKEGDVRYRSWAGGYDILLGFKFTKYTGPNGDFDDIEAMIRDDSCAGRIRKHSTTLYIHELKILNCRTDQNKYEYLMKAGIKFPFRLISFLNSDIDIHEEETEKLLKELDKYKDGQSNKKDIESLACDALIIDGQCDWKSINKLRRAGYDVHAGEQDSFGWLTGVIYIPEINKRIIYG